MSTRGCNIEIFSCSGGMAEGFRRAGITFDWVFDKDPNAVASYTKNLGHAPVMMDARDLLRMVRGGWSPGPVNLLVADPPCTPWSRAGKRLGTDDERDMLEPTAELITLLRPAYYLIGNVPGLQDSTSWGTVQRVIGGLVRHGYCVADYAQLDAADYGVPQHRIRPFWFGHLSGRCIQWPVPTHADPRWLAMSLPLCPVKPWVTCREALERLDLAELGRHVRLKRRDPKHPPCAPDAPATTVRSGGNGNAAPHVVLENRRHPPASPAAPAPTVGAKDRGQSTVLLLDNPNQPAFDPDAPARTILAAWRGHGARLSQANRIGSPDQPGATVTAQVSRVGTGEAHVLTWPWDRPSTTIQRDERIAPPGHHDEKWDGRLMSSPNAIVLSERAASIIQGFPDGWLFAGETKKTRWSQIGQAMPPPLAEAVARSVAVVMARAGDDAA